MPTAPLTVVPPFATARFASAAPWLGSLALHAAIVAGLALFYRASAPAPALQLELFNAALAPQQPKSSTAAQPAVPKSRPSAAPQATPNAAQMQPRVAPEATPVQTAPAPALSTATAPPVLASAPVAAASPPAPAAALPAPKTPARFDAAYLQNPEPAYPVQSRRLGEAGTVQLLVSVNAQGTVDALSIHRSSGFARLDEAAKRAVQVWRFVPARLGDAPTAGTVIVPIVFKD